MGKRGPPYKPPDDAQFIVVLKPPCEVQRDGQVDYTALEYWLCALFGDQRAAKFIYEIEKNVAVIVELPSPEELPFPSAAYGEHSLRLGLKRRPWFPHETGFAAIMPYNFGNLGHPEDTRKMHPMVSGGCEDEWLKFDLTIPYPMPQPYDFSRIPQRARMFCRRPPDPTPPPPDPMDISRYPTPSAQERQGPQPPSQKPLQPENREPLFSPEDDSKPKIKNLDPYEQDESISSFLRSPSSATDASRSGVKTEPSLAGVQGPQLRDANQNHTEPNALPALVKDELGTGNPLTVKREFANQDDTASQRMYDVLNAANRSQSPPEDDRLAVKRELENHDGASAQKMHRVLDAVNRGQSARADGPSSVKVKRDSEVEGVELGSNPPPSFPHQTGSWSQARRPAPNGDRDRDGRNGASLSSNSWRERDERGGGRERERDRREWRGNGPGREPPSGPGGGGGDRKRSSGYHDGRGHEDRGPYDRDHREYSDKRSRANYR